MRRTAYFFTHVQGASHELAARLSGSPTEWLPVPAASLGAGRYAVRLCAGGLLPSDGVEAEVRIGETVRPAPRLVLRAVAWRGVEPGRMLPGLRGDLELELLTPVLSRLSFVGSYQPPLTVVGAEKGRPGPSHVADGVIRWFVLGVAARLEQVPTLSA